MIQIKKRKSTFRYLKWEIRYGNNEVTTTGSLNDIARHIIANYMGVSPSRRKIKDVRRAIIAARALSTDWFSVPEIEPDVVAHKLTGSGPWMPF